MYESFGLIGIQLPEKDKENFDVSSEGTSTCTVKCLYAKYNLLHNSDRSVKFKF
jgi:uncharacterized linocin/CFP29 family protein